MFKFKLKKKVNPHRESLERMIKTNEEYLETMVAGTKEYKDCMDTLAVQYEELRKFDKPKINFGDVIGILGAIAAVGGVGATVATSIHRDNTRKELATWIYQNEELESNLGNGSIKSLATKE